MTLMDRPGLRFGGWVVLALAVASLAGCHREEEKLYGPWQRTSPPGAENILLRSDGRYMNSLLGFYTGPTGHWKVEDGQLVISWQQSDGTTHIERGPYDLKDGKLTWTGQRGMETFVRP